MLWEGLPLRYSRGLLYIKRVIALIFLLSEYKELAEDIVENDNQNAYNDLGYTALDFEEGLVKSESHKDSGEEYLEDAGCDSCTEECDDLLNYYVCLPGLALENEELICNICVYFDKDKK